MLKDVRFWVIWLCLSLTVIFSRVEKASEPIKLPEAVKDTIGDIPLVEQFDDGGEGPRKIVIYKDRVVYVQSEPTYYGSDYAVTTGDFTWGGYNQIHYGVGASGSD